MSTSASVRRATLSRLAATPGWSWASRASRSARSAGLELAAAAAELGAGFPEAVGLLFGEGELLPYPSREDRVDPAAHLLPARVT